MSDPIRYRAVSTIDPGAPSTPANHVQDLRHAIGKHISALPYRSQRELARRLRPMIHEGYEELARRKMALAVEAEIVAYAQQLDAGRQTALVQMLKTRSEVSELLAMIKANTEVALQEVALREQVSTDEVGDRWRDYIAARRASGRLSEAAAARRLQALETAECRLQDGSADLHEQIIDEMRRQIRAVLARAAQGF